MTQAPLPIALTMGEPAGIGSEIALAAWIERRPHDLPPFFLLDDPGRLSGLALRLGLRVDIQAIAGADEAPGLFDEALPVLPVDLRAPVEPGRLDPANARSVLESIETAVALTRAGQCAAVVTNPIHKATLYSAGFTYPGHTEYLAALSGGDADPVMLLAVEGLLRVVPVTVHQPLRAAIDSLTTERIVAAALTTAAALAADFGIDRPRLAVAGLNPHAGEGGSLGREEIEIIGPAVEMLRARGLAVDGPHPPDTLFHERMRSLYDVAICMYHDQALIPLKTMDFERGVNVTLGLPFVRTSPDHGTALNIAGKGVASAASLIAALRLADSMARHRAASRRADVR